jgi:hypothetical protein
MKNIKKIANEILKDKGWAADIEDSSEENETEEAQIQNEFRGYESTTPIGSKRLHKNKVS